MLDECFLFVQPFENPSKPPPSSRREVREGPERDGRCAKPTLTAKVERCNRRPRLIIPSPNRRLVSTLSSSSSSFSPFDHRPSTVPKPLLARFSRVDVLANCGRSPPPPESNVYWKELTLQDLRWGTGSESLIRPAIQLHLAPSSHSFKEPPQPAP